MTTVIPQPSRAPSALGPALLPDGLPDGPIIVLPDVAAPHQSPAKRPALREFVSALERDAGGEPHALEYLMHLISEAMQMAGTDQTRRDLSIIAERLETFMGALAAWTQSRDDLITTLARREDQLARREAAVRDVRNTLERVTRRIEAREAALNDRMADVLRRDAMLTAAAGAARGAFITAACPAHGLILVRRRSASRRGWLWPGGDAHE